ncbi:transglycosylase domain-containing protein [Niveibacterium umoris]|uniref:peptidoglycan glycosyltransferase n=1 Tax=Niveibacterium umoris TaxID=1193620 RepID=A0A840BTM8_9RHOO|nr:transglycosylase domain-containing protein [Niveibacterium umoris]MBB4014166.1 membrane peptidoglycan carboxypeptidase [Niveibacterium umoris]
MAQFPDRMTSKAQRPVSLPLRLLGHVVRILAAVILILVLAAAGLIWYETTTSRFEALHLAEWGRSMSFHVEPGKSDAIRFPGAGPFDQRLGYSTLPEYLARLGARDFAITHQARISAEMARAVDLGFFAPYREKTQGGLTLEDCAGQTLFQARFPEHFYEDFRSVPDLLVRSLLFIENRELLEPGPVTKNPAVEWDRFAKAAFDQLLRRIDAEHDAHGGSTLATQIEKYRHSPEGRTSTPREKLRQMASASLRAYLPGEDTTQVRRQLVVDYLNTVPLAAKPGYGEVIGIGDGMAAWYGRDFAEVNALLRDPAANPAARALAYKQALSLMISQRRPSGFLADPTSLENLTNVHLRLMATQGVISSELRDAALRQPLQLQRSAQSGGTHSLAGRKAAVVTRTQLATLLRVPRLYDLDRLDLSAVSTLDVKLQRAVTDTLRKISDPAAAKEAGLVGDHLLGGGDPAKVIYSFTLFERTAGANLVRVQTDNFDQPFDINEGTKLDLGSTAKLRTLVTYLEIIARLHERLSPLDREALVKLPVAQQDYLTSWAVEYLTANRDASLEDMLRAAMERKYSANPGESFFTGGGLLTFENFDKLDNTRIVSVREALQRSVNLAFIRIMRDIVRHTMFNMPSSSATLLDDNKDPKRQDYLARFADREGKEFISRFYKKYQGKNAGESLDILLQGIHPTPKRLTTIFRSIDPKADESQLGAFLEQNLPDASFESDSIARLYESYSPEAYDLADRGYLAGVHPLELWLVGYLRQHPGATLSQVFAASADERQNVYRWLFKTRYKSAQDVRIKQLVEVEAFLEIHKMWKRLGYPFDTLVPSYATALGSSADRPAALAELVGVLINDGVRLPTVRLDAMRFAADTPYETRLTYRPQAGERVLPSEVAKVARETMAEVVEKGTAKRLSGVFKRADGSVITVGGKTGTGDHRFEVYGKGGVLISERVVSRSGTLVFYIGDRHFGTITAYVKGPEAADYKFTSALPAQLLKVLAPSLIDEINRPAQDGMRCERPPELKPTPALKPAPVAG